jgi:hypothetical protein
MIAAGARRIGERRLIGAPARSGWTVDATARRRRRPLRWPLSDSRGTFHPRPFAGGRAVPRSSGSGPAREPVIAVTGRMAATVELRRTTSLPAPRRLWPPPHRRPSRPVAARPADPRPAPPLVAVHAIARPAPLSPDDRTPRPGASGGTRQGCAQGEARRCLATRRSRDRERHVIAHAAPRGLQVLEVEQDEGRGTHVGDLDRHAERPVATRPGHRQLGAAQSAVHPRAADAGHDLDSVVGGPVQADRGDDGAGGPVRREHLRRLRPGHHRCQHRGCGGTGCGQQQNARPHQDGGKQMDRQADHGARPLGATRDGPGRASTRTLLCATIRRSATTAPRPLRCDLPRRRVGAWTLAVHRGPCGAGMWASPSRGDRASRQGRRVAAPTGAWSAAWSTGAGPAPRRSTAAAPTIPDGLAVSQWELWSCQVLW